MFFIIFMFYLSIYQFTLIYQIHIFLMLNQWINLFHWEIIYCHHFVALQHQQGYINIVIFNKQTFIYSSSLQSKEMQVFKRYFNNCFLIFFFFICNHVIDEVVCSSPTQVTVDSNYFYASRISFSKYSGNSYNSYSVSSYPANFQTTNVPFRNVYYTIQTIDKIQTTYYGDKRLHYALDCYRYPTYILWYIYGDYSSTIFSIVMHYLLVSDIFQPFVYSSRWVITGQVINIDQKTTYSKVYNISQITGLNISLNKTTGGDPKIAHSIVGVSAPNNDSTYNPITVFSIIDDSQIQLTISTVVTTFNQTYYGIWFCVFIWDANQFLKFHSTFSDFIISPLIGSSIGSANVDCAFFTTDFIMLGFTSYYLLSQTYFQFYLSSALYTSTLTTISISTTYSMNTFVGMFYIGQIACSQNLNESYYYPTQNYCVNIDGYYETYTNFYGIPIVQICGSRCQTCNITANLCISCYSSQNRILQNSSNTCAPMSHYVEISGADIAVSCDSNCLDCMSTTTNCTSCAVGNFLSPQNFTCVSCNQIYPYCLICDFEYCYECSISKVLYNNSCQIKQCGDSLWLQGYQQCQDGNSDDHDGCSSTCQIQQNFTCLPTIKYTKLMTFCQYTQNFSLSLVSLKKIQFQNVFSIVFQLTPPNLKWWSSQFINKILTINIQNTKQNVSSFLYQKTGKITINLVYSTNVQNKQISLKLTPFLSGVPQIQSSASVQVNLSLIPTQNGQIFPYFVYSQNNYQIAQWIALNSTIVTYVALFFAILSLINGKTIGIQMMALLQSTYFGLFQFDELIPTYSALLRLNLANGPSFFIFPQASNLSAQMTTFQLDNDFLNNYSVQGSLIIISIFLGIVIWILSKTFFKQKQIVLSIIYMHAFCQYVLFGLIFFSYLTTVSLAIQIKTQIMSPSDGVQLQYTGLILGIVVLLMNILYLILLRVFRQYFGQFYKDFTKFSFSQYFYCFIITQRLLFGFLIIFLQDFIYIGCILAAIQLILAFIVLFKSVYNQKKQNIRLCLCLLYMGFVQLAYMSQKIQNISEVYQKQYIYLMPTAISIFLDILVLFCCTEICVKLSQVRHKYEMAKIQFIEMLIKSKQIEQFSEPKVKINQPIFKQPQNAPLSMMMTMNLNKIKNEWLNLQTIGLPSKTQNQNYQSLRNMKKNIKKINSRLNESEFDIESEYFQHDQQSNLNSQNGDEAKNQHKNNKRKINQLQIQNVLSPEQLSSRRLKLQNNDDLQSENVFGGQNKSTLQNPSIIGIIQKTSSQRIFQETNMKKSYDPYQMLQQELQRGQQQQRQQRKKNQELGLQYKPNKNPLLENYYRTFKGSQYDY